jgi:hypothetical protein
LRADGSKYLRKAIVAAATSARAELVLPRQ